MTSFLKNFKKNFYTERETLIYNKMVYLFFFKLFQKQILV